MDHEIVCNFKKCRKAVSKWAWVTSCSHTFCDEDGTKEFNKSLFCPACETNLSGKFDVLRIDLQPSEQAKSMMLAGHNPETIIEVCSRAMAFWTYQMNQELMYQQYVSTKAKERNTQLEQYYEQIIARTHTEMSTLKSQVNSLKKDLDDTRQKYNEVSEKMTEKSRQYQKLHTLVTGIQQVGGPSSSLPPSKSSSSGENRLDFSHSDPSSIYQTLYDSLRLRSINPSSLNSYGDHDPRNLRAQSATMHMGISSTVDDVFRRLSCNGRGEPTHVADQVAQRDRDFVFHPASTPIISGMQDPAAATRQRFDMQLGTTNLQAARPVQDKRP